MSSLQASDTLPRSTPEDFSSFDSADRNLGADADDWFLASLGIESFFETKGAHAELRN